jgi:hypothetical protein
MNMKHTLTVMAILPIFFFACSGERTNDKTENKEQTKQVPVDSAQIYLDNAVKNWTTQAETGLPELLKKFNLEEDKVEGGGWYSHKMNKNKYKTHIEVPVSTNGYFYLKTNYCGDDWIFHNHLVVNIAGSQFYSSSLESYSDYNVHDNSGGYVYESLHLTAPLQDGYIVNLIAANQDKEITVRFKGDQKTKDITLSKDDKEIILDCFLLSQYLSVTKNDYIQNIVFNKERPSEFYLVPKGNYPSAEIKKTN